jgi:hypothetical protein
MTIREEVSAILKIRIEPDHWDIAFKRLEVAGKMDMRKVHEILAILCKKVEQLENGQKSTTV